MQPKCRRCIGGSVHRSALHFLLAPCTLHFFVHKMKPKNRQKGGFVVCLSPKKNKNTRREARRRSGAGTGSMPRPGAARKGQKTAGKKQMGAMLFCRVFGLVQWCTITRVQPLHPSDARLSATSNIT